MCKLMKYLFMHVYTQLNQQMPATDNQLWKIADATCPDSEEEIYTWTPEQSVIFEMVTWIEWNKWRALTSKFYWEKNSESSLHFMVDNIEPAVLAGLVLHLDLV